MKSHVFFFILFVTETSGSHGAVLPLSLVKLVEAEAINERRRIALSAYTYILYQEMQGMDIMNFVAALVVECSKIPRWTQGATLPLNNSSSWKWSQLLRGHNAQAVWIWGYGITGHVSNACRHMIDCFHSGVAIQWARFFISPHLGPFLARIE